MSLFRQKLSKVKCGKCQLLVPLRQWPEHTLQHTALKILKLSNYPSSFLQLTQHYCGMLEELAVNDRKNTARLTTAYDTLKMLYFKDFKEPSDDHIFTPEMSPAFEKMTEALAPPNFNYSSWDDESSSQPPTPYSYSIKVEQLQENIFHSEEVLQELRQTFFTADPITPELNEEEGFLWGCALFEGLKGNTAAKHVAGNFWKSVRGVLAGNTFPSPPDIRRALKRSMHKLDVSLKQGHEEVGQSRWSGVTGCVCILQNTPQAEPDIDSRPSTRLSHASSSDLHGNLGMVHIANIGSVTAVMSRNGAPKRITFTHTAADKAEKQRVIDNGAAVSSSGQVNCVTTVTRALGFHGDANLRQCLSQNPYCNSIPIFKKDEFIVIANSTFWKYIGGQEACNMCCSLLQPSLRKLVHIFTTLPDQVQEEALSQTSTLDYDALVSDFGDNSQDSSMIPDNESESNIGEEIDWAELFDDPIENLTVEGVCKLLADAMSNSLVEGVREAGAVGPVACSVILLQGALQSVKRRLFYEQAIHELKKRYNDYALSEVSLMSSTGDSLHVDSDNATPTPTTYTPASAMLPEHESVRDSPMSMLSHQPSAKSETGAEQVPKIAEHLTLGPGNLVFQENTSGVLKLTRSTDNSKYNEIKMEALQLDGIAENLSKQEQRDMIRDMVTLVLQQNTTPEPPQSNVNTPTAMSVT